MIPRRLSPLAASVLLWSAPAAAQRPAPASTFPRMGAPEMWAARPVPAGRLALATGHALADTGHAARRRARLVGGIAGGLLGGAVGGVLGVRARAVGCDAAVGATCPRPRHTWIYPVVGAGVGAGLGGWVARRHDGSVAPAR